MISKFFRTILKGNARLFSTSNINFKRFKVAIIGGAGGCGQNLALLLKINPLIYKLSLYDLADFVKGVGVDLSHVDTNGITKGYGKDRLVESLECCDVVLITPGGKRMPNMKREDHWNINAQNISGIARIIAKVCPDCFIYITSNPVNSLTPLVAEIFKQECVFNPSHIFGQTSIDVSRTKVLAGEILGFDPACIKIPVIGGHSEPSIVPLFSKCQPSLNLSEDDLKPLYKQIQLSGEAVAKAKHNKTATLSMAYGAAGFTNSLLRALNCEPNINEIAYVQCDALGTKYCSSEFILGGDGISKLLPQPSSMSAYEEQLLKMGIPDIKKHVKRGEEFADGINPYKQKQK